ncbi:MAG: acyl-CoA dehydrogenase [Acidimicrobiia bacterium]|nr:acyl-CoA dehydrogenase [Acidimicrobiia bacterium]
MNFAFTEEQEELRKTVRAFLDAKSPETAVREQMETVNGFDPAVWSQMGSQMGLMGIHIPEEFGGMGFSYIELGVVLEEMGRSLLCAPYFSTVVMAANTLMQSGDEAAKKKYLPAIASGETTATLASVEPSGKWDESGVTMQAKGSGSSFTLTGTKMFVLDGHTASLIIVSARTAKGVSLFAVDGNAKGLTRTALSTMDQTRKQAKLEFADVPATLIGTEGKGWEVLTRVNDLIVVALAAEQVGGAQKVLDMAVEYAKVRVQFGRPIGSFQAIKHKCADMLLEVESAKSAAYYGMWCAAEMNDELPSVASLSKAYCETQARLTFAELRKLLVFHMRWLHDKGLQPAGVVDRRQDIVDEVVIDEQTLTAYLLDAAEKNNIEILDDVDAVYVVKAHLKYFDAIGAIGPQSND